MWRDVPVLIDGEASTEKQAVARLIHELGASEAQPFVVVDLENGGASGIVEAAFTNSQHGTLFFPEVAFDTGWQLRLLELLSQLREGRPAARLRVIGGLGHPVANSWEGSLLCHSLPSTASRAKPPRTRAPGLLRAVRKRTWHSDGGWDAHASFHASAPVRESSNRRDGG